MKIQWNYQSNQMLKLCHALSIHSFPTCLLMFIKRKRERETGSTCCDWKHKIVPPIYKLTYNCRFDWLWFTDWTNIGTKNIHNKCINFLTLTPFHSVLFNLTPFIWTASWFPFTLSNHDLHVVIEWIFVQSRLCFMYQEADERERERVMREMNENSWITIWKWN